MERRQRTTENTDLPEPWDDTPITRAAARAKTARCSDMAGNGKVRALQRACAIFTSDIRPKMGKGTDYA